MDKQPIILMGKSIDGVSKEILNDFQIKHEFKIKIDYTCVKSIDKLRNLCEKYPPKVIIMENENKCNNTLGVSYNIPKKTLKLIY